MAIVEDAILKGEIFEDALRQVCFFFQIDKLYEDDIYASASRLCEWLLTRHAEKLVYCTCDLSFSRRPFFVNEYSSRSIVVGL